MACEPPTRVRCGCGARCKRWMLHHAEPLCSVDGVLEYVPFVRMGESSVLKGPRLGERAYVCAFQCTIAVDNCGPQISPLNFFVLSVIPVSVLHATMMLALAAAVPTLLVGHGRAPLARRAAAQMAAPESTPKTEMKLTPTLIEWGVDAELWGATRNKQARRPMCTKQAAQPSL